MKSPLFYAKVLLFGEYGIIKDSKALSIPYNHYNGMFQFMDATSPNEASQKSNESLRQYARFLKEISEKENALVRFDIQKMQTDIANGMYFNSSIPQGYGVGSSGALVAAFYHKYAFEKIEDTEPLTRENLLKLKEIFGQMESFFHGKSSGLDPLNSYVKLPILIHSQNQIQLTGIPIPSGNGTGAVFLIDSGMVGETAPMVQIFMEKMKQEGFRRMLKNQFIKYTDACVEHFLQGNFKQMVANVKKLSSVVLNNFQPMIPQEFHQLWQQGIDSGDYFLKLCGSGGGGYILGFTENFEKAQKALKNYKLEVVYKF